jgi:hypothetical protein
VRRFLGPALLFALVVPAVAFAAKAPTLTVTIAANRTTVVFGETVGLSGAISTQKVGEKVAVQAQACGQTAFKGSGDTNTTTAGNWALNVTPTMNTQYRAKVKNATSAVVAVNVHPRVTLTKVSRRKYKLRVFAAQSFAGKLATFQRLRASTGTWVRVRKPTLRQVSTTGATIVSGITFRAKVRARLQVRAVLPKGQVGACYLSGVSNVIRS